MKMSKKWNLISGIIAFTFLGLLVLAVLKTTFFGEHLIGVVLEYEPHGLRKGSSVLYGYEIGGISYVDHDSYSSFQKADEGDCIQVRHYGIYPFESVKRGEAFKCESSNKLIVYGELNGKNNDDTVFVSLHSKAKHDQKKFTSSKYYLVLDTIGIYQVNFRLKNHNEKVLFLDLTQSEVTERNDKDDTLQPEPILNKLIWILNLDAHFSEGHGSDTVHFGYSSELDEIILLQ